MSQRNEHNPPPKPEDSKGSKGSPKPLRFTLETESKDESKDEWISSVSGHACARIFPDKVFILTSKSEDEFKQPEEIVIEEPNVKAVVFLKETPVQNQLVCATKNGVKVYDIYDPKKPVLTLNFDKPYEEADFSSVKMSTIEVSPYNTRTLFIIHQTKTSSKAPEINFIKINLLSKKIELLEKIHYADALDVNKSVIRVDELICANRNSKLVCFSLSYGKGKQRAAYGYYLNNFEAFNNLNGCTIHNIWTQPDLQYKYCHITALHYEDSSKTHNVRIYSDVDKMVCDIVARVNYKVAPLIIKRTIFYLEADTNDIYSFDPSNGPGKSTFVSHTYLKDPRHLLPVGEGKFCVEGNVNGKLVYEMFSCSEVANKAHMRIYEKKEVVSAIKNTLLDLHLVPDVADLIISYTPYCDIPDEFFVDRMNEVPSYSLSAIDPDHRFFSDKFNPWIWDARHVDKNGEMQLIPLLGSSEPPRISEVIWLGNNRIAQICNRQKLIVYALIETSKGCEAHQESKELDFPIKPNKARSGEFLTCQLPDSRVLFACKLSNVISMIDLPPQQNTTPTAHYFKEIMTLKGAWIYTLNILHPDFIRVKVYRPIASKWETLMFQIQSKPKQRACSLKKATLKMKDTVRSEYFWVTHTNHVLTYLGRKILSSEFDPKMGLVNDKCIYTFPHLKEPPIMMIEMLPNGGFLFAHRSLFKVVSTIDVLIYNPQTNDTRVLIGSSPEKEIEGFFLTNGGTLGLNVKGMQRQYRYEFHNFPEIRDLYKPTSKITAKETKEEKKSDAPLAKVLAQSKPIAPTHFFRTMPVVLSSEQTILMELDNLTKKYRNNAQQLAEAKELALEKQTDLNKYREIINGLEYINGEMRTSATKKIYIISEAKKLSKTFSNFVEKDLEAIPLIKKIIELNSKPTAAP